MDRYCNNLRILKQHLNTVNKKFDTENLSNIYNNLMQTKRLNSNKKSCNIPRYNELTTQHNNAWYSDQTSRNTNNLHDNLILKTPHNKDPTQLLTQPQLYINLTA